ncbi:MAG TPA: peptidoglycan-binding domain-containing protein [Terriglobales bacterium]
MDMTNQIRRWRYLGLCAALCLGAPTLVIAKSDTPTAPPNQAQASTSTNAAPKAKQSSSATSTVKHTTAQHPSSHPSPYASIQKSKTARGKKVARKRGQQAIDSARAREIQTALIREHYLQGQPTGTWDGASQAAMQKYQADHGWQSKTTPDARALIKLGLGPNQDHLLNPESAMTATSASAAPQPSSAHATAVDPKTPAKPTPAADSTIPKQ